MAGRPSRVLGLAILAMASIIPLPWDSRGGPVAVWLVSREGWTELEVVPAAAEGTSRGLLAVVEPALPRA